MARRRTRKTTVLLLVGGIVTSSMLVLGLFLGSPALAAGPDARAGANRTTVGHVNPRAHTTPSATEAPLDVSEGAVGDVEQGTTADDLTLDRRSSWWLAAWVLLAVPAGTALAWWVSRPQEPGGNSTGPLYS